MKEIREKVEQILAPIAEAAGAFVVDVGIRNEKGGKLVQVFADTDKGITIEECAAISRELGRQIEVANLIQTFYRLEVSSPGIDKPIRLLRQYHKNVGRPVKISFRALDAVKSVTGALVGIKDQIIEIRTDEGEVVPIDFSTIIESRVVLPW